MCLRPEIGNLPCVSKNHAGGLDEPWWQTGKPQRQIQLKIAIFLPHCWQLATSINVVGTLNEFVDVICREHGAVLMGVLNVTPDSFYDGNRYLEPSDAIARVDRLLEDGADLIDIGAESTRPGAPPVKDADQLKRALPALTRAVERGVMVSIDTTSPEVARVALLEGARVLNDVSCLANPELARVAQDHDADLILMHSRGSMSEMPGFGCYPESGYDDVVADVILEWRAAQQRAIAEGLPAERIWFDPGLGFHKSAEQSQELLKRLGEVTGQGIPTCLGPSRKSFIGALDGSTAEERLGGTVAACLRGIEMGARILRVHDVRVVKQAIRAYRAFAPSSTTLGQNSTAPAMTGVSHDA